MIDTKEFRSALGQFATGVCVVTTQTPVGGFDGMTVNSFSSVSLDPPLVLWSIQNSSERFNAFHQAERFAISVLGQDQEALSNQYAQKGDGLLEDAHYELSQAGLPIIQGALATFECQQWAQYPGGDHTIIVGEVLQFNCVDKAKPLLFYAGNYSRLDV